MTNPSHDDGDARAPTRQPPSGSRRAWVPVAVFAVLFLLYNANGREISNSDSQPTRYAAVELAMHRKLVLDRWLMALPALRSRPGFATASDGHVRSAYPVVPALLAGGVATSLARLKLLDLHSPTAPSVVAKLTASALTALGVTLAFVVARRRTGTAPALLIAAGLGLGTSLWPAASQTLWQMETVVAALGGVLLCLAVPTAELTTARLWAAALLLGVAGAARPQVAPAIGIVVTSIAVRRRRAADVFALLPLAAAAASVVVLNMRWFGHPLGAVPVLESLHASTHATEGSFGNPVVGALGLLVSPSRGLIVFSPIVLAAAGAWRAVARCSWRDDLRWWVAAVATEFAAYASYSVWWGGHTYGPRYGVETLPLLVPVVATAVPWLREMRWRRVAASVALAWSILLAATGAFVYPSENWNSLPENVDQAHERLWDWRDPQFVRCWKTTWSPSNFRLFKPARPPLVPAGPPQ